MTFEKVQPLWLRSSPGKTAVPSMPTPCRVLTATAVALALGLVAFSTPKPRPEYDAFKYRRLRRSPGILHTKRVRRSVHPSLQRAGTARRARRPAPAHQRHALARQGNRRRSVAGDAVGQAAGARSLLGHGLRLAEGGGEAQCPAAVRHDDRRARHSLHPRPLPSSKCPARHHYPWLAGVRHGAAQSDWSADRSHRTRRTCAGRLRCRHTLDAGLRLLRQADNHGLEPGSHRASLGGADEAHWVHPLRRPRR